VSIAGVVGEVDSAVLVAVRAVVGVVDWSGDAELVIDRVGQLVAPTRRYWCLGYAGAAGVVGIRGTGDLTVCSNPWERCR